MLQTDQLQVRYNGISVGVISLTPDNKVCAFQYDRSWLLDGFSISPFELPLREGIFLAKSTPFAGNFGIFEDSLPDGYGRYLLHKALLREGVNDFELNALQRLSIVGSSGMGALTFHPETKRPEGIVIDDFNALQQKALEVLSEKSDDDAGLLLFNSGNSGGCRPKAVFSDQEGHWLVKFRHTYDPQDMGLQEYHYNEVAKACGIDVPDFRLMEGKYFASRRFDIDENGDRCHVATASGLLCISLSTPILDYSNLLALTGVLTKNPIEVEEMFRRMVFNYFTDNKDDHCKNFSYIVKKNTMGDWQWKLSPAYDLTLCTAGYNGEHATSINQKGNPSIADMIKVGTNIGLKESKCRELIDQVHDNCKDILIAKYR